MTEQPDKRALIEAVLAGDSPQKNYQQAFQLALQRARKSRTENLELLGIDRKSSGQLVVPSLGGAFQIDLTEGKVIDRAGENASMAWAILALHYSACRPGRYSRAGDEYVSFMDIPEARGYAKPYQGRVIGRFLHTAGVDKVTFKSAAVGLAGEEVNLGDAAFEFAVFPRARVQVIWYRGDNELAPGASFSFGRNIPELFCVEDIVVMAELLVAALSKVGRHSAEKHR